MSRKYPVLGLCFALCLTFGAMATARLAAAQGDEQTTAAPDNNADVMAKIAECASKGDETVLSATGPRCAKYRTGSKQLADEPHPMPLDVSVLQSCPEAGGGPVQPAQAVKDKRVLPAQSIKTLAKNINGKIDPTGLRIIGAIFCDNLDLIGLNLPYSLVLDRSIFVHGIDARNFRSSGDFSVDDALVFGELRLTRARVEGSVFGSGALIQKAEILDSEITGSVLFRRSLLLEPAIFDTARISGELSLQQSAFPYFLLQFASVGGVLDLTNSQARCSYQLRTSKIGDLVVDRAGFGRVAPGGAAGTLFDWDNLNDVLSNLKKAANSNRAIVQQHSQNAPSPKNVKDALDDEGCDYGLIAAESVFVVSDVSVNAQLCLRKIHWPSTSVDQDTFVTLNDVTIGATAFIDLTENVSGAPSSAPPQQPHFAKRQFEMLGLNAKTLIVNFGDKTHSPTYDVLYANGLGFSQVYAIDNKDNKDSKGDKEKETVQCGYIPEFAQPHSAMLINNVGNLSQLRRPKVDEVMALLSANKAETTQPFSAFVDAFQKNGETSSARELQIKKANAELRNNAAELTRKIRRLLNVWTLAIVAVAIFGAIFWLLWRYRHQLKKVAWLVALVALLSLAFFVSVVSGIWTFVISSVGVAFGAILWLLADNGFRPEKVGWFVILILVLSFVYFWFVVKVIAIRPEKKSESDAGGAHPVEKKPLPIGFTFLFDRLLPAYQIREDHYKIAQFLMRVPKGNGEEFSYFTKKFHVAPVDDEAIVRRVERALDVIKFLGLVLAIFLVAALNALVSH